MEFPASALTDVKFYCTYLKPRVLPAGVFGLQKSLGGDIQGRKKQHENFFLLIKVCLSWENDSNEIIKDFDQHSVVVDWIKLKPLRRTQRKHISAAVAEAFSCFPSPLGGEFFGRDGRGGPDRTLFAVAVQGRAAANRGAIQWLLTCGEALAGLCFHFTFFSPPPGTWPMLSREPILDWTLNSSFSFLISTFPPPEENSVH